MRRIVLIDFDWHDVDLLPELLRQSGVSVRLVAGTSADDPGVRVAELCGVPHTLELSDLTREIFDLGLIGEHSTRRASIESLLQALGTTIETPAAFLARGNPQGERPAARSRGARRPEAPAPEVDDLTALLDRAIPDLAAPNGDSAERRFRETWLTPVEFRGRVRIAIQRNQQDGERYAIHRLSFLGAPGTVEVLCQRLPRRLRATDCLCRPAPGVVLLLLPSADSPFAVVRARIAEVWDETCRGTHADPTPILDERVDLASDAEVEGFLATANRWLAVSARSV